VLKDGVTDKELGDGKTGYKLQFDNQLAQDDFIAFALASGLYLDRTLAFEKKQLDAVMSLKPAQVNAAARKHLDPSRLTKVKAGDLKKSAPEAGKPQASLP